jgi:zinc transport system ATP-binding protein
MIAGLCHHYDGQIVLFSASLKTRIHDMTQSDQQVKQNHPADAQGGALLVADNVSLKRRGKQILKDISLSVNSSEIITLIGPNGAGKTSLVRVLLGLLRPSSGQVRRAAGLRIGYVPQRLQVPDVMPLRVFDFLNVSRQYSLEQCRYMLREVDCQQLLLSPMQTLSGGETQRVLLARALLKKPQLLVLDEPVAGMDVIGQKWLYEMIQSIRDRRHCGILMVSHDLHLVMAATDRVICLNTHICCTGHPDAVSEHPEYLKLFGDAVEGLALYAHHHDHEHDVHGNILTGDQCHSCEHKAASKDPGHG